MIKYLLDTCVCIELLSGNERVHRSFGAIDKAQCAISEMTQGELLYGVYLNRHRLSPRRQEEALRQVCDFCDAISILPITPAVSEFARQKAALAHKGQLIEDTDLYIGCTAKVHGLTLVTDNVKHLSRIEGLAIDNWME